MVARASTTITNHDLYRLNCPERALEGKPGLADQVDSGKPEGSQQRIVPIHRQCESSELAVHAKLY
jgi:hypothetical protein